MACTVASSALTTVEAVLRHMRLSPQSLLVDAFSIYVVGTGGSSAATLQVDQFNSRVQIVITGGSDAGTHNYTITPATTTLSALKTAIEADIDAEITLLTHGSQLAVDMPELAATGCLGLTNMITVRVRDTCRVAEAINRASELVERTLNRRFASATYTERLRVSEDGTLFLKYWPIIGIRRICTGETEALRIVNTDSTAAHKIVRVAGSTLYLQLVGGSNDGTNSVTLTSNSLAQVVSAIAIAGDGWTATVVATANANMENLPATWLFDAPGETLDITNTADYVSLMVPERVISDYTTDDYAAGVIKLGSCRAGELLYAEYDAGFATVPADVVGVVNDVAKEYYLRGTRDTSMRAERLGDYSYELGDTDTQDLQSRILSELHHYTVPMG